MQNEAPPSTMRRIWQGAWTGAVAALLAVLLLYGWAAVPIGITDGLNGLSELLGFVIITMIIVLLPAVLAGIVVSLTLSRLSQQREVTKLSGAAVGAAIGLVVGLVCVSSCVFLASFVSLYGYEIDPGYDAWVVAALPVLLLIYTGLLISRALQIAWIRRLEARHVGALSEALAGASGTVVLLSIAAYLSYGARGNGHATGLYAIPLLYAGLMMVMLRYRSSNSDSIQPGRRRALWPGIAAGVAMTAGAMWLAGAHTDGLLMLGLGALLSLSGVLAGGWHGWQMVRWLERRDALCPTLPAPSIPSNVEPAGTDAQPASGSLQAVLRLAGVIALCFVALYGLVSWQDDQVQRYIAESDYEQALASASKLDALRWGEDAPDRARGAVKDAALTALDENNFDEALRIANILRRNQLLALSSCKQDNYDAVILDMVGQKAIQLAAAGDTQQALDIAGELSCIYPGERAEPVLKAIVARALQIASTDPAQAMDIRTALRQAPGIQLSWLVDLDRALWPKVAPGAGTPKERAANATRWTDPETRTYTLELTPNGATVIAFSPDGALLAAAPTDDAAKVWHTDTGRLAYALDADMPSTSVAFSADGALLATGARSGAVQLWNATDGSPVSTLPGHASFVLGLAFSPDGTLLASGGFDGLVNLWRVSDGELLYTLQHPEGVRDVAFSVDGSLLACACDDNVVHLWRVTDGQEMATLEGHTGDVLAIAFSPDGSTLASGSRDNKVRLWRLSDGELLRTLDCERSVESVAFSSDGSLLVATPQNRTIRFWRVSDGEPLQRRIRYEGYVNAATFSPDGSLLATASNEGLRLWTPER